VFGLDDFDSLVPDYILRYIDPGADFLAGTNDSDMSRQTDQLHSVAVDYEPGADGMPVVIGTVRLFSIIGAPTYRVSLGRSTLAGWTDLA
jgi:hypothetical protein